MTEARRNVPGNLRIVISCVTFETVKIVEPSIYFRADKVYLIHKADVKPYDLFLDEVIRQFKKEGISVETIREDIFHFQPLMKRLISIIREEKKNGNNVYVNIGAGSTMFIATALIASMMEGCITFNVGTEEYTVKDYEVYFEDGRPVGLTRKIHDPFPLPDFRLERPDPDLVDTLRIWIDFTSSKGFRKTKDLVRLLEDKGYMGNVLDENNRVKHGSVMEFRRVYLDRWLKNGWIRKEGRGRYSLTDQGKMITEIFPPLSYRP
jgi:hypothetical protein